MHQEVMMTTFEAIIMGCLQGLTEFLPVSSSGHLEIASEIFGIEGESNLAFATAVHAGTVFSTIVVFWKQIVQIISGFFKFKANPEMRFVVNILVSMIPVAFVGLFFKDQIEGLFTGNLLIVGIMLLITGALLTFSSNAKPRNREITIKDAFIIGIAQAFATLPGLSRSGSTISTGLLLGVKREDVASFSFLMVLIPILGINFLDIVSGDFAQSEIAVSALVSGFIAAFISGMLACKIMINLVKKGKLIWFAIYCFIVGTAAIIYTIA